jgi:hypothetical protein
MKNVFPGAKILFRLNRNDVSFFAFQVTTYKPRLPMLGRRFTLTTTKSSGTAMVLGIPQQKQIRGAADRAGRAGISLPPTFMEEADLEMLERFGDKFRLTGIDFGPGDSHEIKVLEQFLDRHVQKNQICDVQCMLLWNEWVRTFQRRTPGFPKLIREKEFRNIITENFNIKIASNGSRGAVYPGIKFVP